MTIRDWLANIWAALRLVGWAFSCLGNAFFLGERETSFSARFGWSIREGGFWSRLWLPGWLRRHFIKATEGKHHGFAA